MKPNQPLNLLKHHVTGAIERGEKQAIVAVTKDISTELYDLLSKINEAFYSRTTRKQWLDLMEQTKPLLQKARGEL